MKAIVDGDLVIGTAVGDYDGPDIPNNLLGLPLTSLRHVDGLIIDARQLRTWYVDPDGNKRAVNAPGRKKVTAWVDDRLVKSGNTWTAEPPARKLLAYLGDRRYRAEIGGVVVDGVPISTERASMAMLTALLLRSQRAAKAKFSFKAKDGTAHELTAADIGKIFDAATKHVEDCFKQEADIAAQIEAGEITTLDEIDQIAWPASVVTDRVDWHDYHDDADVWGVR